MWEICIYNYKKDDFNPDIKDDPCPEGDFCTFCPTDICLIDCEWNQYHNGENDNECTYCPEECTEGCTFGTNCNQCIDRECQDCDRWENCTQCIENADCNCEGAPEFDAECTCDMTPNAYFFEEEQNLCVLCDSNCAVCYGTKIYECEACQDGFAKQIDIDICTADCPSGYTESPNTNTCDGDPDLVQCFTFDRIQNDYDLDPYYLRGGNTAGVEDEPSNPFAVYRRGAYFDGVGRYFLLTGFLLNHTFTIKIWAKPQTASNFFTINKTPAALPEDEDFFTLTAEGSQLRTILQNGSRLDYTDNE